MPQGCAKIPKPKAPKAHSRRKSATCHVQCYVNALYYNLLFVCTLPYKKLLLKDENWYRYRQFYSEHGGIRKSVDYSINQRVWFITREHHCSLSSLIIAQKNQHLELSPFEFITRFIQHLPEKGFRLIRYFGFLANRSRTLLLPVVSALYPRSFIMTQASTTNHDQLII